MRNQHEFLHRCWWPGDSGNNAVRQLPLSVTPVSYDFLTRQSAAAQRRSMKARGRTARATKTAAAAETEDKVIIVPNDSPQGTPCS